MFLSWTALVFLIVAAGVVWFWQDSLAARERANAAAIECFGETHTVRQRSSNGALPAANSTRARPVPRNDGSTPKTRPPNGTRGFTASASRLVAVSTPLLGTGNAAGNARPASFAAHICRTFMRGMRER